MTFHPFALAGALVATSLTVLAASPVSAAGSVHVSYADGVKTGSGDASLDAQLHAAARSVCIAQERELAPRLACTEAAYRDAREQLRLAQAGTTLALR